MIAPPLRRGPDERSLRNRASRPAPDDVYPETLMPHVTAHADTHTLRICIGAVDLHVRADDAPIFSNLLRRPPACGLSWHDALDEERAVRLRAVGEGTELTVMWRGAPDGPPELISWAFAVDVVGEITGSLGHLRRFPTRAAG